MEISHKEILRGDNPQEGVSSQMFGMSRNLSVFRNNNIAKRDKINNNKFAATNTPLISDLRPIRTFSKLINLLARAVNNQSATGD